MKIKSISLFAVIFILFFSASIQASIEIGNLSHQIQDYYGAGAQISGWINISIDDEDSDALFEDSIGNSMGLLDLIKSATGVDYSCLPLDCKKKYIASNPENSKTIQLRRGETALFGFKIMGKTYGANSIDFTLESDAGASCFSQLKIDLLLDGTIEFSNNKSYAGTCLSKTGSGCFDQSKSAMEIGISEITPYCQRMTLPEAPSIEVGAWVKRVSGNLNLTMWLYDEDEFQISDANCLLPQATLSGSHIYCHINYPIKETKEYLICLTPENEVDGEYNVRGYAETQENACGFHKIPTGNTKNTAAYDISFKERKFASIGTIRITDTIGVEESLSARATDYIIEKYGTAGESGETICPEDGCVIPMKLISSVDQEIQITDLVFNQNLEIGQLKDTKFYDITESVSKVSTNGFQKISLEKANFSVGEDIEDIDYIFLLGQTEIFEQNISIESVPVVNGINPSKTVFGYPTEFKIKLSSARNMSSYSIDFGDGKNVTSIINSITHTYNQSGTYSVTVTIVDINDRSSTKTFPVVVETPESFISSALNQSQDNLENINAIISAYPKFYQEELKKAIQFSFYEEEVRKYKREFAQTFGDEPELFRLVSKILNFSIPKSIEVVREANDITFYPQSQDVDLVYLSEVAGGNVPSNSQKYIEAILGWNQKAMDMKIDYLEFSVIRAAKTEHLVSFFEITLKKLQVDKKDPVIIIDKIEDLTFENKAIIDNNNPNYATMRLSAEITTMLFSTTSSADFSTLPMFVSLPIDYVPVAIDSGQVTDPAGPNWLIYVLIIIFLAITGAIVYIFLQIWYKKKYEKYLFPNKTGLYNLVSFVQTSRKKGMPESDIKKSLSKSGWSGEHIAYAMKKHAGKRTGMVELPVGFILDKMSKKEKGEGGPMSKRPSIRPRMGYRMPQRPAGAIVSKRRLQLRPAGVRKKPQAKRAKSR